MRRIIMKTVTMVAMMVMGIITLAQAQQPANYKAQLNKNIKEEVELNIETNKKPKVANPLQSPKYRKNEPVLEINKAGGSEKPRSYKHQAR